MEHKEISLEEMKQIEVEILLSIDSFCKENNLRYIVGYGTLIGAVRHQGFIPWDDDIDLWMPRPDYDKFIDSFKNANYQLLCMEHGDYYRMYAKVCDTRTIITNTNNNNMGVFVDVIPIDGLPSKENEARHYLKKMIVIRRWIYKVINCSIYGQKKPFLQSLLLCFFERICPVHRMLVFFLRLSNKYSFESSDYVGIISLCSKPYLLKRAYFEDITELMFEGHKVNAPLNYDECLRALYGDYMKLPPEKNQIPSHAYHAYWK